MTVKNDVNEAFPNSKTIHLVYIGKREIVGNKYAGSYYVIDPEENNGDSIDGENRKIQAYKNALVRGLLPGMIVSVQITDDERVYVKSASVVGTWKCKEDVQTWLIDHRAIERMLESTGKATKKIKQLLPMEQLKVFNEAYRRAPGRMRPQILAMVIHEITKF